MYESSALSYRTPWNNVDIVVTSMDFLMEQKPHLAAGVGDAGFAQKLTETRTPH